MLKICSFAKSGTNLFNSTVRQVSSAQKMKVVQGSNGEQIIYSPYQDTTFPDMTLPEYVWKNVNNYSNKIALVMCRIFIVIDHEWDEYLIESINYAFCILTGMWRNWKKVYLWWSSRSLQLHCKKFIEIGNKKRRCNCAGLTKFTRDTHCFSCLFRSWCNCNNGKSLLYSW